MSSESASDHGVSSFPIERLAPPEDEYDNTPPPPDAPAAAPPTWQPPVRVQHELVFPPRPPIIGRNENGTNILQPVTSDWLHSMVEEQRAYHHLVKNKLKEAQSAARDAAADVMLLKSQLDAETSEYKGLFDALRMICGRKKVEELQMMVDYAMEHGDFPEAEYIEEEAQEEQADHQGGPGPGSPPDDDNDDGQGDKTHIIDNDVDDNEEPPYAPQESGDDHEVIGESDVPTRAREQSANNSDLAPAPSQSSQHSQNATQTPPALVDTGNPTEDNVTSATSAPTDGLFARMYGQLFPNRNPLKRGREKDAAEEEEADSNTKDLRKLQKSISIESIEFISSNVDTLDRSQPKRQRIQPKRKTVSRADMYTRVGSLPPSALQVNATTGPSTAPKPIAANSSSNTPATQPKNVSPPSLPTSTFAKTNSTPRNHIPLANRPRPPPTTRREKERTRTNIETGEPTLASDYAQCEAMLESLRTEEYQNQRLKKVQADERRRREAKETGQPYNGPGLDNGRIKMNADVAFFSRDGQERSFRLVM